MNAPIQALAEQVVGPDASDAHEAAREEAFEEFIDWQRADYDRREFEDFGNWLANKASWNRPNKYQDALTYAERRHLRPDLKMLVEGHKGFNQQERRAGGSR